jgi:hypothetical protein
MVPDPKAHRPQQFLNLGLADFLPLVMGAFGE